MEKPLVIKFSHKYPKLMGLEGEFVEEAKLLEVVVVDLEDLSPSFLEYDSDYGKFEFPESGRYLMLIFLKPDSNNLFTTLRKGTEEIEHKYRSGIGKKFKIGFKPGI